MNELQNQFHSITSFFQENESATLITGIVGGVLPCFFGYRLLKSFIGFLGFIIGAAIGGAVGTYMNLSTPILAIVAIAVGVICGWLSFKIYKLGVFIATAGALIAFFQSNAASISQLDDQSMIGFVIAALVIGIFAIKFIRPMVIFTTSLSGAFLIANTIQSLVHFSNTDIVGFLGIIITICGISFQMKTTKNLK